MNTHKPSLSDSDYTLALYTHIYSVTYLNDVILRNLYRNFVTYYSQSQELVSAYISHYVYPKKGL